MLETPDCERLAELLRRLPRNVVIPAQEREEFFKRHGVLPFVANEHRRYARKYLRQEAVCEVLPTLPAIVREHGFHRVSLRDVSRGGISFVHSEQLFPQERVVLWTSAAKLQ